MPFGYAKQKEGPAGDLEMTFSGEELDLMMEAFRATDAINDPVGEKIMLRYLSTKVALQEKEEQSKPKMGFLKCANQSPSTKTEYSGTLPESSSLTCSSRVRMVSISWFITGSLFPLPTRREPVRRPSTSTITRQTITAV